MKFFDWRLWISEDFESEEIGVTLKTWYSFEEDEAWRLLFRSFIFSFLSHRKHCTVKGGRGNTKEKIPCDAQLKSYTYQSLRVKSLEISYSSVNFFTDRDEVLLVFEEFIQTGELGIR